MSVEVFNMDQGSLDWFRVRSGCITASNFKVLFMTGRGGKGPSESRAAYMRQLAGEILTGEPADAFETEHTLRGHGMEQEARDFYALRSGMEPEQVGFIRRAVGEGFAGASPDSLIGADGLLEIKTRMPKHQIAVLLDGTLPEEHAAQVQGQLWVTGRAWCDYLSYWPGLPPLEIRVQRDPEMMAKLDAAVPAFVSELQAMVKAIEALKVAA